MFPNLIADEYEGGAPVKTAEFLFVGGPKHGEHLEVIATDRTFKVFAPPSPLDSGAGGYELHTYVRRKLALQSDDGTGYERAIFVHEVIPSPDVAQQMLMAALLTEFIKGGKKVIDHDAEPA